MMPRTLKDNLRSHTVTAVVLCLCLLLGLAETILWGRAAPDDLVPLCALLLLLSYDHFIQPWESTSKGNRTFAWGTLLFAVAFMTIGIAFAKCPELQSNGQLSKSIGNNAPMLFRNFSLTLLVISVMQYQSGWNIAGKLWTLPAVALLLLPFFELMLLQFSFPLRLLSTNIAVAFLRILSFNISSNSTTMLWQGNEFAITDACSGMSLIGLLIFIAYWIIRKSSAPAWQKYCWFSLLLLWILLSNSIRLLLTLFGYMLWGDYILTSKPHLILGCIFVITNSLLLWFSNVLFFSNNARQSERQEP